MRKLSYLFIGDLLNAIVEDNVKEGDLVPWQSPSAAICEFFNRKRIEGIASSKSGWLKFSLAFRSVFFFDFNEPATSLSSTDPTISLAMSSAMWSKHLSCWPRPSTSRNLSAIPCVAFEFLNGIRIKLRLNKRWENQNSKEGAFSMEWIYLSLIPSYNSTSVWCNCNPKQQKIGGDNIHTIKISEELMHWHMLQDLLFHLSGKPVRAVIECRRNSLLRRDTRSTSWPNMVMPTFLFQLIASRINKQSYGNSKYDSRYPRIQGIKITCLIRLLTSSIWPSTNYVWVRREHVINWPSGKRENYLIWTWHAYCRISTNKPKISQIHPRT